MKAPRPYDELSGRLPFFWGGGRKNTVSARNFMCSMHVNI